MALHVCACVHLQVSVACTCMYLCVCVCVCTGVGVRTTAAGSRGQATAATAAQPPPAARPRPATPLLPHLAEKYYKYSSPSHCHRGRACYFFHMDDDLCLPKATLEKVMKEYLGSRRCSSDLKDAISSSCTELIHMLAAQANAICERKKRKTIMPEDVIEALKELELDQYIPAATSASETVKETAKASRERRANVSAQRKFLFTDEMRQEQERMLAKAREAVKGMSDDEQDVKQDGIDEFSLDSGATTAVSSCT
eukprot:gene633-3942_t